LHGFYQKIDEKSAFFRKWNTFCRCQTLFLWGNMHGTILLSQNSSYYTWRILSAHSSITLCYQNTIE
jgi:hypothetical protein